MKKNDFLALMQPSIIQYGWTVLAMEDVSLKLGLDKNYYLVIFKDGIPEIADYYDQIMDLEMISRLSDLEKPSKIRHKISLAVKTRLKLMSKVSRSLSRKSLWNTADVIWKYAGDESTDFNYYTKRAILSLVYTMSFRHYLKSNSDESIDEYVDNVIDMVLKIFSIKSKLPKLQDIPILRMFS
ncbi:MAG: COQ9 family protein [Rickettsiaceae bacterium]|nr:COQ9 family protein [Rickettsiaceae bacterium]